MPGGDPKGEEALKAPARHQHLRYYGTTNCSADYAPPVWT